MKRLGPHSRPGQLAIVDGRSAEGRRMKEIRLDLTEHVGGSPSVTQRMMIERIAVLLLRMELMDARALRHRDLTEKDAREYLGWNNAATRMLRGLGLKSAASKAPTLASHLAARQGTAAA